MSGSSSGGLPAPREDGRWGAEWADMEAWLDEHPDFTTDYFARYIGLLYDLLFLAIDDRQYSYNREGRLYAMVEEVVAFR